MFSQMPEILLGKKPNGAGGRSRGIEAKLSLDQGRHTKQNADSFSTFRVTCIRHILNQIKFFTIPGEIINVESLTMH